MSDEAIIRVEGLWKRYGLPLPAVYYQTRRWLQNRRGPKSETKNLESDDGPWALRDVSFEVRRGETLGIIGRNGAGKSTLLKVLAGVTPPTRGTVDVRGRVFPMIELNAGMHMELTGRENVFLLGAVMGMSRAEVQTLLPAIEEFCELGEWFDRPVRMYSSGMLARLGFGVAMNVRADVLLIDEVLAVGDLAFQRKCFNYLDVMRKSGTTFLLVTHNVRQVERLCDRVVHLDDGKIAREGVPEEVVQAYIIFSQECLLDDEISLDNIAFPTDNSGDMRVVSVSILNKDSHQVSIVQTLDDILVRIEFDVFSPVQPLFGIAFNSIDNIPVLAFSSTIDDGPPMYTEIGRHVVEVFIPKLRLLPGVYSIALKVRSAYEYTIQVVQRAASIRVVCDRPALLNGIFGLFFAERDWYFYEKHDSMLDLKNDGGKDATQIL